MSSSRRITWVTDRTRRRCDNWKLNIVAKASEHPWRSRLDEFGSTEQWFVCDNGVEVANEHPWRSQLDEFVGWCMQQINRNQRWLVQECLILYTGFAVYFISNMLFPFFKKISCWFWRCKKNFSKGVFYRQCCLWCTRRLFNTIL